MYLRGRFLNRNVWIFGTLILCIVALEGLGQTVEPPVLRQGEVKGDDVYVRSGPSENYYPVSKLDAGDRVTIVGETGDWYEILPLEDTFSFISGDYVDTTDNQTGVVNGHNVRVRAGSALPEFNKLMYVVQTKLSKGAEVTILGRLPDGFLRIKPPAGVTVWINRNYVEFVPDTPVKLEREMEPAIPNQRRDRKGAEMTSGDHGAGSARPLPKGRVSDQTAAFGGLDELDTVTLAELEKPVLDRQFAPLIERYGAIAEKEEDEYARRYAQARLEQLTNMAALIDTIQRMRKLDEEADAKRRQFLEGRAKIREMLPPVPTGLDAQGILRVSAIYPRGARPQRYRLVDPTSPRERTAGYVEIPQNSTINMDAFLGRYVGVRASAKRLQSGGVDPVPIYVVGDLVLLQPTTPTTGSDALPIED